MKNHWIVFSFLMFSTVAGANPSGINISGRISLESNDDALSNVDVDFKIRVLSPDGCVLYTEKFLNQDLQSSAGIFNLTIGNGDVTYNAWGGTYGPSGTAKSKASLLKVFSNSSLLQSGLTAYYGETCAGGAYTPADGDVRRVVIEFSPTGVDNPSSYVSLLPAHTIRSVPYAMLADLATDSEKLGGLPASQFAKLADLSGPGTETDPTVLGFAKTVISNLASGRCAVGSILTFDGTSLVCVPDSGSAFTLGPATATTLGGIIVPSSSGISVDVAGNVDLKDVALTKVTGLQTALDGKVSTNQMAVCTADQIAMWSSVTDSSACQDISIVADQINDFNFAVDARVAAGAFLPLSGTSAMSGNLNLNGHNLVNSNYLHLTSQTPSTTPVAGYLWYNSAAKGFRYSDGVDTKNLVGYTGASCADDGVLKWDDTAKQWVCGTDAGAGGGVDAISLQGRALNAVTPVIGEFLQYSGASWSRFAMPSCAANSVLTFSATGVATCENIAGLTNAAIAVGAGIARSKIAAGAANHVLINDGSGVFSSEAQLAVSRGGTGLGIVPTTNQILIGSATNTYELKTLTAGTGVTLDTTAAAITINATATAPSDAGYSANTTTNKGVVSFDTNAATSGVVINTGQVRVNAGTAGGAGDANKIAKLSAAGQLSINMIPDLSWTKITSGTPTTITGYGITDAVRNVAGTPSFQTGNTAGLPTPGTVGRVYIDSQTNLIYRDTGSAWVAIGDGAGTGTVTSVALSLPSVFTVANSPVTTNGTLTATLATQAANSFFVAPNGSAGAPTFRSLVSADIPNGAVTGAKLETVSGLVANTYGSATQIPSVTVDVKGRVTAVTTNTIVGLLPSASGVNGKYLKSDGASWAGQDVRFTDIKNAAGLAAFSGTACTANQALSWSAVSDSFTCQAIAINASAITSGEIDIARLPSSVTSGAWTVDSGNLYRDSGNVGIGTTTPTAKLEIAGGSLTTAFSAVATLAVNFNTANVISTTATPGTLVLSNMRDGTSYTLIVQRTGAYTLSGSSVTTWRCAPACPSGVITNESGHVLITILKAGTVAYVSYITDMQ